MNPQLKEIASWRMATEICRRHRKDLTIIETHPGGGQYDCLSIFTAKRVHIADLNRMGRLHFFHFVDGEKNYSEPIEIWNKMLCSEDCREGLKMVCRGMRLDIHAKRRPSSPKILTYRFIADFLSHSAFRPSRWECRNGYCDSSGMEGCFVRRKKFGHFPGIEERLRVRVPGDFLGEPAYRFWFLEKNGTPLVLLETTGFVWIAGKRDPWCLMSMYRKRRRIWPLISEIAGHLLP